MFSRSCQVVSVILIFFLLFKFLDFISFEFSTCSSCSFFNYSFTTPKTIYKILNNTEDERTSVDDYSIWCLHMAHRLESEIYFPQSPIIKAPSINSTRLHRLPYRYSQWKSSSNLSRRLTPCEHNLAMRLLMIIERICRKHHITFMLSEGSLLGSWRHHDIIPWDDDLDIMIPIEDKNRFINLMEGMNKTSAKHHILSNTNTKREYYKLFLKNTPSAGGYSWNFPFIDIFLYEKNETHLWLMADPDSIIEIEYIFPLVMRPFGELWLPTPQKPEKIFQFDPYDQCKGHYWNHRKETGQKIITTKCDKLKEIYPFVERTNQSNSTEILKQNNTILHTIIN